MREHFGKLPAGPIRDHLMAYSKTELAELVYDFVMLDLRGDPSVVQDEDVEPVITAIYGHIWHSAPVTSSAGALYVIEMIRGRAEAIAAAVSAPDHTRTARKPTKQRVKTPRSS